MCVADAVVRRAATVPQVSERKNTKDERFGLNIDGRLSTVRTTEMNFSSIHRVVV